MAKAKERAGVAAKHVMRSNITRTRLMMKLGEQRPEWVPAALLVPAALEAAEDTAMVVDAAVMAAVSVCVLLVLLYNLHPRLRRLLHQPGCDAAPPTRHLRLTTTRTRTRRSPEAATDAQHVSDALRPWLLK